MFHKKLAKRQGHKNENAPSKMISIHCIVLRKMHCVQSSSFIDKAHRGRIISEANFKMDIGPPV